MILIGPKGTYLLVIEPMLDLLPVHVDGVVVVLGIHDEASPLPPPRGDVRPVVFVQVFTEIAWKKCSLVTFRGQEG